MALEGGDFQTVQLQGEIIIMMMMMITVLLIEGQSLFLGLGMKTKTHNSSIIRNVNLMILLFKYMHNVLFFFFKCFFSLEFQSKFYSRENCRMDLFPDDLHLTLYQPHTHFPGVPMFL